MKITFITHSLAGGGSEHVLTIIANYFATHGYEVTIISRTHKNNQYSIDSHIDVQYVETKSHLIFLRRSRQIIRNIKPNTVISFEYFYNMCAVLICLGLNVKLLISERNDPARVGSGFIKSRIRNILYSFADVLICQTDDAKNYFPDYIRKKVFIILNPIMSGLPSKQEKVRDKVIVNFCRLNKQKNIPLLISAFEEFYNIHPDYELHIYGDGAEKETILDIIYSKHLERIIKVFPNTPNVHELVINAAMFVSTSDFEGLSNSMLEALSMGLPTICTDCPCGGARMVIEDGVNGFLIPVNDQKSLVDKMLLIAGSSELTIKLSNNALKINNKLNVDNICKQWISLL